MLTMVPAGRGSQPFTRTHKALVVDLNEALLAVRLTQQLLLDADENNCCVCLDKPRNMMITPCNHLCLCQGCAHTATNECPLCRGPVGSVEQVYL